MFLENLAPLMQKDGPKYKFMTLWRLNQARACGCDVVGAHVNSLDFFFLKIVPCSYFRLVTSTYFVSIIFYTLSTFSMFKLHIGINKVGHCDCKHITTQKVSYTYVYYIYVIDTYN